MLRCSIFILVFLLDNYDCTPNSTSSTNKEALQNKTTMQVNFKKGDNPVNIGDKSEEDDDKSEDEDESSVINVAIITLIMVILAFLLIILLFNFVSKTNRKPSPAEGHVPMVEKRMGRLCYPIDSTKTMKSCTLQSEGNKAICSASELNVNECNVQFSDEYKCYTISRRDNNRA